jgi:hypothetical protein
LALFALYPPDAIGLIFASQFLFGFFYGITIPLRWTMFADVADYSEWKNDRDRDRDRFLRNDPDQPTQPMGNRWPRRSRFPPP